MGGSVKGNWVLLSFFLMVLFVDVNAQQEPLFSQYMNSQLYINPGYAGVGNALSTTLTARNQWIGVEGAPNTVSLGIHSPFNKSYASMGGVITSDHIGPVSVNSVGLAYSYLLKFNVPLMLSLGVSGGVNHYTVGLTDLFVKDHEDPSFATDVENKFTGNAGLGAFLFSQKFYLGVSVPRIIEYPFSGEAVDLGYTESKRHYYLSAGYAIPIGKTFHVKPSLLTRLVEGGPTSFDINAQVVYKNIFWLGASYRVQSAMAFIMHFQMSKNWSAGYSYDFAVSELSYFKSGSHEITIGYEVFDYYRRSKHRRFPRKKVEEKPGGIKSIRMF